MQAPGWSGRRPDPSGRIHFAWCSPRRSPARCRLARMGSLERVHGGEEMPPPAVQASGAPGADLCSMIVGPFPRRALVIKIHCPMSWGNFAIAHAVAKIQASCLRSTQCLAARAVRQVLAAYNRMPSANHSDTQMASVVIRIGMTSAHSQILAHSLRQYFSRPSPCSAAPWAYAWPDRTARLNHWPKLVMAASCHAMSSLIRKIL